MENFLNMSGSASLALHAIVFMSAHPEKMVSTNHIASSLGVSEAHLHKVFQRLVKTGIVKSIRGPKGGFMLRKPLDEIRLLDVFQAIEGPYQPDNCLMDTPDCKSKSCILGDVIKRVNNLVMGYLSKTKLSQLTEAFEDMNLKQHAEVSK
ncbi:MAG TPA: Rrf2 family transcriptional regulator [Anaerolineae bacterium]|nr:Rrf2 family transcriptional regulator [Anaerolineae bacterium]